MGILQILRKSARKDFKSLMGFFSISVGLALWLSVRFFLIKVDQAPPKNLTSKQKHT